MSKPHHPVTPAIRFLRAHKIEHTAMQYPYEEHGGTAHSAECLGIDEHQIVKTIVLINEYKKGLIVLMPVPYTHLRAHETDSYIVCRLLLETKN